VKRPRDRVRVVTVEGDFDAYEKLELQHDFLDVAQLRMTFGDDRSWESVSRVVAPGRTVKVYLNDLLQFTGRFEANRVPVDATNGSVVQVSARTRLADTKYGSADLKLSFKNASIRDFILRLFAPHGYFAKDFLFAASAERDLVTGKKKGFTDPVDLEPLKFEQAKVSPPETTWEVAERMLKRHHLMFWDAADGRILVGRPDDTQAPLYVLRCLRGKNAAANNLLQVERVRDWTDVAGEFLVLGGTFGKDARTAKNKGVAVDLDLARAFADNGQFFRRVYLPSDGAKTAAQAQAQAKRELAQRAKDKDAWSAKADGWSFWDGSRLIPYCINTTVDLAVETIAAGESAAGRYLVARTARTVDRDEGFTTELSLLAPGIFDL
jgi:prophage tail gpP-like protein